MFDAFAPAALHGKPRERTDWAVAQVKKTLTASKHLGLTAMVSFSGALAWPFVYPWPQRPAGLIDEAFDELARRWRPILDHAEDCGVDICFEIHPGEDLHDGDSYEMFLDRVGGHARACMLYDPSHYVLPQLDYIDHLVSVEGIEDLYVAGDNTALGRTAGEYFKANLPSDAKIVVLRGIPTTIDNERVDAFQKAIECSSIEIINMQYGNWNRDDAFTVMQDFLSKHAKIDAVRAADDDMAAGVMEAIAQAGREKEM